MQCKIFPHNIKSKGIKTIQSFNLYTQDIEKKVISEKQEIGGERENGFPAHYSACRVS